MKSVCLSHLLRMSLQTRTSPDFFFFFLHFFLSFSFFTRQKDMNSSFLHKEMQILVVIPLRSVFLTVNAGLPVPITGAAR